MNHVNNVGKLLSHTDTFDECRDLQSNNYLLNSWKRFEDFKLF